VIRIIDEGDRMSRGLNICRLSDGGFACILWIRRLQLYFRLRARNNPVRPRYRFYWDWTPAQ
jgi:hypothetical protein